VVSGREDNETERKELTLRIFDRFLQKTVWTELSIDQLKAPSSDKTTRVWEMFSEYYSKKNGLYLFSLVYRNSFSVDQNGSSSEG
jgi:hypothetical protein